MAATSAHPNLIEDDASIDTLLTQTRRVAVLGVKPETHRQQPAFYVPAYLVDAGLDVVPVPVYYPDITQILGRPVFRSVTAIQPPVDLVDVFRRPQDLALHVDDLIAAQPKAVWFQLGIRNDAVALQLAQAGIRVVQDRCLMVDHRHWAARRQA
jgi:predicted CoA-binding protein